ncbi:hypothetical protein MLD38_021241 [Melastoma candidum]|uniref:Uncharacterized protein n=1 Tax=Melastoma candidum TaxID=119954 RepID=A0ACB9QG07_9MYRT|nr:hypothetical protein MLD38_021241 [Melastoma candidum]
MTPFVSKDPRNAYFNYKDFDIGITSGKCNIYDEGKVYGVKYFGQNFEPLVEVKTRVDPENFFRNEQSIPPRPRSASSARPGSRTGGASRNLRGALMFFFTLESITITVYIF